MASIAQEYGAIRLAPPGRSVAGVAVSLALTVDEGN